MKPYFEINGNTLPDANEFTYLGLPIAKVYNTDFFDQKKVERIFYSLYGLGLGQSVFYYYLLFFTYYGLECLYFPEIKLINIMLERIFLSKTQ